MADVGTATIRILADSSAFDRSISNLSRGAGGVFNRADAFGERFGSRIGAATGKAMKVGLVAAAGGLAAAVGVTLAKGFKRFTTIEDATASLTLLLGDAADAAKLLDDTLKVVEGTPFALDQFVDAARNLAAASIPMEKIPRILTAIADGAAAAGGSAEDVDNVVNAIGRLATGAELTLGPIRDLEEQGVPALRILANQMGVTTRDLAKDISAGKVATDQAIDDLVEGIINGTEGINGATVAFGGAAKNVGNTVSGAFSNMQIAVDRAGANIIKVFADSGKGGSGLVKILNANRRIIDLLGKAAVRFAENFVEGGGMDKVLDFFERLESRVASATEQIGDEGGFRKALLALFDARNFEELTTKALDGLRRAFERIPAETLGGVITVIIVRGIESITRFVPIIVGAMVKAAPAIIKGILEGLLRAARDNPLEMTAFLAALAIPGVGPALAALFGALPFGFIVKPLITGLTNAIGLGLGRGALVPASAVQGSLFPPSTLASTFGPGSKIVAAMKALGPLLVAAMAGWAIGTAIEQHLVRPVIKEFDEAADHVTNQTAAMKDRFITELGEMAGVGSEQLFPVVRVLNEMQRNGDLSSESMFAIHQNLELIGASVQAGIDVRDVIRDLADGGITAEEAMRELRNRLVEVGESDAHPRVEIEGAQEAEGTLSRILGSLGDIVGRAWRAVVGVDTSGGASGSFHRGGLVMHSGGMVPKLHAGTMNAAASALGGRLRSDERLAVLQVGELVLSKNQVAQARQNAAGGSANTFNIYEVGDAQTTAERIVARLATG